MKLVNYINNKITTLKESNNIYKNINLNIDKSYKIRYRPEKQIRSILL